MNTLQILTSHLGLIALGSTIYIIQLLKAFSRRIGEVTKMPAYYRWFDAGSALIAVAFLGQAFLCSAALTGQPALLLSPTFALCILHLPLALGVGITLVIAFIYWGWLIHEH
mgnify:FL=1